jgi:hypothetical protein
VFCIVFRCLRWEVIVLFVDIRGIVDHHWLNFLLIKWEIYAEGLTKNIISEWLGSNWVSSFRGNITQTFESGELKIKI